MTRIIAMVSGKGGVGKSTVTANLGTAMADFGANVVAIDANLTTPNLGMHLGIPLYPKTMHDVLKGKVPIHEAIYRHQSGLRVIPAGISLEDLRGVDPHELSTHLLDLVGIVDYILLDASAGLGKEALASLESADESLIVTTPDMPAVTDALKAIKLGEQLGTKTFGIAVNRITGRRHEMTYEEILTMLDAPIIAEIPEDRAVHESITARNPVVHHKPNSPAAREMRRLAAYMLGVHYDDPWWRKIFGYRL